jgi:hypothetical protein
LPDLLSQAVGIEFRPLLTLLVEMIGKDYNELPSRDSTRCSTLASQAAEIAELKRQLSAARAAGSAHGAALMASKAVIDDSDLGPASALLSSPEQVCSTINCTVSLDRPHQVPLRDSGTLLRVVPSSQPAL